MTRSTPGGIHRIQLGTGSNGEGKAVASGRGLGAAMPVPADDVGKLRVQLINSNGACWESEHETPNAHAKRRFVDRY